MRPEGFYWVRFSGRAPSVMLVAEWHNGAWYFAGVEAPINEDNVEVLAPCVMPSEGLVNG